MHELVVLLKFDRKSLFRFFNYGRQAFTLYNIYRSRRVELEVGIFYTQYYKLYKHFPSSSPHSHSLSLSLSPASFLSICTTRWGTFLGSARRVSFLSSNPRPLLPVPYFRTLGVTFAALRVFKVILRVFKVILRVLESTPTVLKAPWGYFSALGALLGP